MPPIRIICFLLRSDVVFEAGLNTLAVISWLPNTQVYRERPRLKSMNDVGSNKYPFGFAGVMRQLQFVGIWKEFPAVRSTL